MNKRQAQAAQGAGRRPDEITGRELIRRQLKRLRESSGLSMQQLADEFHYSKGRYADMESGRTLPTKEFAAVLDQRFKPLLKFTELLSNVRDALIAEHMKEMLPKEQAAVRIQTFSSSVMPGLLQTEEYARALTRASIPGAPDDQIAARVSLRMERQLLFFREDPPFYWAILDEAVLARTVGTDEVMAEQLRHLEEIILNPRNKVQILPFAAREHGMMGGSLNLWTLRDGRTVALAESFGPGEPIESPTRVSFYSEMFDEVKINALSPEGSLRLIRRYLKDYHHEADDGQPVAQEQLQRGGQRAVS
ncbi:helix-turn-helix domain-containing protein [Streptomyces aidingensis]|uniref:Helix-turn-helix domain-containing protein n=1 Tax=Streptomyces aidingensis TaxID=910347 RepID=A0A1I1R924_9ACTN|nr:helix-turn-helix transcriptional regulator [Streptomyces aidingensis]SFD26830.1 Helix-turn-helix domain-containing protein [Streptomyces aidingensis]